MPKSLHLPEGPHLSRSSAAVSGFPEARPDGAGRQPGRTGGAGRPPRTGPPSPGTGRGDPPSFAPFHGPHRGGSPSAARRTICSTSLLSLPPPPTRQRGLKPGSRTGGSHGPEPPHQIRVRLTEARPGRGAPDRGRRARTGPAEQPRPPARTRSLRRRHTGRPGGRGPGPAVHTHQGHR